MSSHHKSFHIRLQNTGLSTPQVNKLEIIQYLIYKICSSAPEFWGVFWFCFYCGSAGKESNPPAMWETWDRSLGWEDPLEMGKATHASILAWTIPGTIQSMGSQRVGLDGAILLHS